MKQGPTFEDWVTRLREHLGADAQGEVIEELADHATESYRAAHGEGATPAEAKAAVEREIATWARAREALRRRPPLLRSPTERDSLMARAWCWYHDLLLDLRFAFRAFLKSPSLYLVAAGSMALAIGVNASSFSVVNALLLEPLPYPSPERLVWVDRSGGVHGLSSVSDILFASWKEHSRTLDAIAAYGSGDRTLTGAGEPERLAGLTVSAGFFELLGASMLHGRSFDAAELASGGEPVAILSHSLWQRRFGSDDGIVGRSIQLDDKDHRVVGVLPADFRFFEQRELWLPLVLSEEALRRPPRVLLAVFGRLRSDVTPRQAAAELETIRSTHAKKTLAWEGRIGVAPLHDHLTDRGRRLLLILGGAVALIQLIACANIANLLLARAAVRRKEFALRAALGAGRLRLLRQMLAEAVLLAVIGGACGLLMAGPVARVFLSLSPPETWGPIARAATIDVDLPVLGFAVAASLLSGILFGLAPALQFSKPDLAHSVEERGVTPPRRRLRQALLVTQVALAVVLLVGAGLLMRSLLVLLDVDPGFRAEKVLTFKLVLRGPRYPDRLAWSQFQQQLLKSVGGLPGVESVGAVTNLPLTGVGSITSFTVDGTPEGRPTGPVVLGATSPGYFKTMGIRLRSGRYFEDRDAADGAPVVVINESLHRLLSLPPDPIGEQIPLGFFETPATVIGVVGDVRREGRDKAARPELYVAYRQWSIGQMTVVVRSALPPGSLATALRQRVHALDPRLPITDLISMERRLTAFVAPRRFTLLLLGLFAGLAVVLASIGVYGVTTYLVTQRTREMAVRRALGATAADVRRLFVEHGIALGLCGVFLGLLGAVALARLITSLLFGVSSADPIVLTSVSLLMMAVVLSACWLPSRRASAVDPLVALRAE